MAAWSSALNFRAHPVVLGFYYRGHTVGVRVGVIIMIRVRIRVREGEALGIGVELRLEG